MKANALRVSKEKLNTICDTRLLHMNHEMTSW